MIQKEVATLKLRNLFGTYFQSLIDCKKLVFFASS